MRRQALGAALWLASAALAAGCGSSDDDRPLDAQYITEAILAPTCGAAECHSTFAQSNGVVLDTYDGMRNTMVNHPLLSFATDEYDPAAPDAAVLIIWLTQTDPFGRGIGRMPYDAPMPNADVDLLKAWITGPTTQVDDDATCEPNVTVCPSAADTCIVPDGATIGECYIVTYERPANGAECDPSAFDGLACNGAQLVKCNDDWNFGDLVQACPTDCVQGKCSQ